MAGTSTFADGAIRPEDAASLTPQWRFRWQDADCYPSSELRPWGNYSTPVVWGTTIYQGYTSGCLVALDTRTKHRRWMRDFGFQPPMTCRSDDGRGIMSTPAITEEPAGDGTERFVYLHAPNGFLYKLHADTGHDAWTRPASVDPLLDPNVNDYYAWSSPLPLPKLGLIVVGLTSNCDIPFARGGLKAFSMASGRLVWTWWSMPANPNDPLQWDVGGGVWTGASSDGSAIYASIGSATDCFSPQSLQDLNNPEPVAGKFHGVWHQCDAPGDQYSIVKIDARTGARLGKFRAPQANIGDPDFGSGTTTWSVKLSDGRERQLVGACNKDGWYYVVNAQPDASGHLPLVWKVLIGSPTYAGETACLGGAVYDTRTQRLFLAGNVAHSDGAVTGRVRRVNPATGATVWETALPSNPLATGTVNSNGVLAYAGMHWGNYPDNGVFLLRSTDGAILRQLKDPGNATSDCRGCTFNEFGQPVWADGRLWMSNMTALTPWTKPPSK